MGRTDSQITLQEKTQEGCGCFRGRWVPAEISGALALSVFGSGKNDH